MDSFVVDLESVGRGDGERVGGKNASLGEMIAHLAAAGIAVPGGFATTAAAFSRFLSQQGLGERIKAELASLEVEDVEELAKAGTRIRSWVMATPLPGRLQEEITTAYGALGEREGGDISVAVRSSATAEDLPDASFAGQQESFLNVRGTDSVLAACRAVYASLFSDRAIAYRVHQGFDHAAVAMSVGVQRMVRADVGVSGVMFTLDPESGFRDVVFITASYGLGASVVQGTVDPDEFYVYKPAIAGGQLPILRRTMGRKTTMTVYSDDAAYDSSVQTQSVPAELRARFCLTDAEVAELARQAILLEQHYGQPMDIEWGKDGTDGRLYLLQARPETVKSRTGQVIERYHLAERGRVLCRGRSVGQRIGAGTARVIGAISDMSRVGAGEVLVTGMTDPDWEPVMKRAAAIVTDRGGRTCHAAIIARELGIPAVVGCGDATGAIRDGAEATVSCAEGDTGFVYAGRLDFERREITLASMPEIPVKVMMNIANPDRAFDFALLPHRGIGLARLEFIINVMIGIHPKALLDLEGQPGELREAIRERIAGYLDPVSFYVDKLAEGVGTLAAAFAPQPVIVRTSDFKSNEYANLLGGEAFEPREENPMLGFRGAARYVSEEFRECFELECQALRKVREEMGLRNLQVMIPFVRTVGEARKVMDLLAANGLKRGQGGLKVIMMCELPSNALLADDFLELFDGFSIGSNDLTQLTLGLDRDSALIAPLFDERDGAVKKLLGMAIESCRARGKYIGICGQGPSDHPDLAEWLVEQGIESMSLNPDTVVETWLYLAGQEKF